MTVTIENIENQQVNTDIELKRRIDNELNVINQQVKTVRTDKSNRYKIHALINISKKSEGNENYSGYIKEWIKEQIEENHLPESSSGSFVSALLDMDTFLCYFDIEENEYLYNYVSERISQIRNNNFKG